MNKLLAFALVPLIIVLPGCGALALQRQNDQLGEVVESLNQLRKEEAAAREKADANHDGKLTGSELLTYGGLLAAAAGGEIARRKAKALDARHEESAEHRNALEEQVAELMRKEDIRIAVEKAKS